MRAERAGCGVDTIAIILDWIAITVGKGIYKNNRGNCKDTHENCKAKVWKNGCLRETRQPRIRYKYISIFDALLKVQAAQSHRCDQITYFPVF